MVTYCVACGSDISELKLGRQRLFPLPVGSMAKTSFPDAKLIITCFCLSFNEEYPKDKATELQTTSIFTLHVVVAIIKRK